MAASFPLIGPEQERGHWCPDKENGHLPAWGGKGTVEKGAAGDVECQVSGPRGPAHLGLVPEWGAR